MLRSLLLWGDISFSLSPHHMSYFEGPLYLGAWRRGGSGGPISKSQDVDIGLTIKTRNRAQPPPILLPRRNWKRLLFLLDYLLVCNHRAISPNFNSLYCAIHLIIYDVSQFRRGSATAVKLVRGKITIFLTSVPTEALWNCRIGGI